MSGLVVFCTSGTQQSTECSGQWFLSCTLVRKENKLNLLEAKWRLLAIDKSILYLRCQTTRYTQPRTPCKDARNILVRSCVVNFRCVKYINAMSFLIVFWQKEHRALRVWPSCWAPWHITCSPNTHCPEAQCLKIFPASVWTRSGELAPPPLEVSGLLLVLEELVRRRTASRSTGRVWAARTHTRSSRKRQTCSFSFWAGSEVRRILGGRSGTHCQCQAS